MNRFDKIASFFAGKPVGELIWYYDFSEVINVLGHITGHVELLKDFGCTFIDSYDPNMIGTDGELISTVEEQSDDKIVKRIITPIGSLEYVQQNGHPVKYPVSTVKDCEILKYIYDHRRIDRTKKCELDRCVHQVCITGSSPVQQLLQWDMGMENFYYLAVDAPSVLESLLDSMQRVQIERTRYACSGDSAVIYQAENTSTTMISPYFYEQYSLPQIREQADIIHKAGKRFIVHMCGLLYELLDLLKLTGMDGIHSVTPPPVGNTPFESVYQRFGNSFPVQGRFGSTQWHALGDDEIRDNLRQILTFETVTTRPFVLLVTADGVKAEYTEIKRLQAIIDDINRTGRI
jgi:hypothetical protein